MVSLADLEFPLPARFHDRLPHVMSVTDLSKVVARSLAVRETVKKSKASHVCDSRVSLTLSRRAC